MRAKTVGMIVIRTWMEDGAPKPLRAQVTSSVDVALGIHSRSLHTTPEDVLVSVRTFLDAVWPPEE